MLFDLWEGGGGAGGGGNPKNSKTTANFKFGTGFFGPFLCLFLFFSGF